MFGVIVTSFLIFYGIMSIILVSLVNGVDKIEID